MSENTWSDNDTGEELDPIGSILSDWTDPEEEEEEFRSDFFVGFEGRRKKAALVLMMIWGGVMALHLLPWGHWLVWAFTLWFVFQGLNLILAPAEPSLPRVDLEKMEEIPSFTLLVAAKNEEAVIESLVETLCDLDYPADKYELWVINDNSADRTTEILDSLATSYPQLHVLHRPPGSEGGKSGALNQALKLSQGEIVGVFDADAQVPSDLLSQMLPLFQEENMGAVQVRKAIANTNFNFWTKGQAAEMALDAYFQQQRIALGGIGELRGNGQFVRRSALERCGGWNEETITDDLDLSIRLHLDNWEIGFLEFPAVGEEGVTNPVALWHQRNRWAEGGYQRYLDYWRVILRTPLNITKVLDLSFFIWSQYLLTAAVIPDTLMAIAYHQTPLLFPMTSWMFGVSTWGMFTGLRRTHQIQGFRPQRYFRLFLQVLQGMLYMTHWFIILPSITARMSIRQKRLKWVKTVHQGHA